MQAIQTRWIGPTNYRGSRIVAPSRIVARCAAKRIIVSYSYAYNVETNHLLAAQKLAEELGWFGRWQSGELTDGSWCHVMTARDGKEFDASFSSGR